jgi:uncharacterized SAM-binding protein YcdF (DUF218 family)
MKYIFFVFIALIVFIGGLSIFLQPNDFIGCPTQPEKEGRCKAADAIVVVSGGDTHARTDMGIQLYKNGWAQKIIFSGAAQDPTGPSNAAVMEQHALDAGVPEEAISIEGASRTTGENAQNTRKLLAQDSVKSIILVTSGYHQRRASIEFKKLADGVDIKNHPVGDDRDWSSVWWLTPRGWWLAGGETVKIVVTSLQGESV